MRRLLLVLPVLLATVAAAQEGWQPDAKVLKREGGGGTADEVRAAIDWLLLHQSPDGRWACAGFVENCGLHAGDNCEDPGSPMHDVGVTGLTLLLLTATGSSAAEGPYREPIAQALRWLLSTQEESGLLQHNPGHDFFYDHLIATYALCEATHDSEDAELRAAVQRALAYVELARNPYGAWRYDVPPIGDVDTSVTVWALTTLAAGVRAGYEADLEAFRGGLAWIDEATYGERIGYDAPATLSARTPANEDYDRLLAEAMTAAGLWARLLLGHDPTWSDMLPLIETVAALPPDWRTDVAANDMYAWYHGTLAMFQVGGKPWKKWNAGLKSDVAGAQRDTGGAKGSWDPIGPWGYSGGRVYATATLGLSLAVYTRYPRFSGGTGNEAHRALLAELNAAPRILAASDVVVKERMVEVETFDWRTPTSKRLEVRYTLDGSAPGPGAKRYRKGIVLKDDADLVVQAFLDDQPVGETAFRRFKLVKPLPGARKKLREGLDGQLFRGSWDGLPDTTGLEPDDIFTVDEIELPPRAADSAVRLSGYLAIEETELYRFSVRACDGVRLTISGREVVDLDGVRDRAETVTGEVALGKGWHELVLEWFNAGARPRLQLEFGAVSAGALHRPVGEELGRFR